MINGDRRGVNWSAGGGWNDATPDTYPDTLQITFAGQKTITEIDVFTLQDNYANPSAPTEAQTFTQYGLRDFEVQYWDGSVWVTVLGGSVTNNDRVWRRFDLSAAAVTTDKIRVVIYGALAQYSRVTEVEAYAATLTLLVLAQINSTLLGLLYLAVFGLGSIIGMILMSGPIGLPFAYSSRSLAGFNRGLQTVAGILSICFGLWYAYEKGIANGLLMAAT